MPRPWEITVAPQEPYVQGRFYRLRVTDIAKSSKPQGLAVDLQHLDLDQQGRLVRVILLPPRPEGLTADYFRACGMDVRAGETLRPRDTRGMEITATFSQGPDDSWEISDFAPAKEHTS